jgi:hypothetical protein
VDGSRLEGATRLTCAANTWHFVVPDPRRIGLVGCLKSKLDRPAQARDLYTSPLFRGRRRYVERACDRWFVLSAKHVLVAPDTVLEPYGQTLKQGGRAERRRWSAAVLSALEHELGSFKFHRLRNSCRSTHTSESHVLPR